MPYQFIANIHVKNANKFIAHILRVSSFKHRVGLGLGVGIPRSALELTRARRVSKCRIILPRTSFGSYSNQLRSQYFLLAAEKEIITNNNNEIPIPESHHLCAPASCCCAFLRGRCWRYGEIPISIDERVKVYLRAMLTPLIITRCCCSIISRLTPAVALTFALTTSAGESIESHFY